MKSQNIKENKREKGHHNKIKSLLSVLLNLFGILFIIVGVLSLIIAIFIKVSSIFLSHIISIAYILSEIFYITLIIAVGGITFGYLLRLSHKWLNLSDKNGVLLSLLLSITFLVFSILFLSHFPFSIVFYFFVLIFAIMSAISFALLFDNEFNWKKSASIGILSYVIGIFVILVVFELFSAQNHGILTNLVMQSLYSTFKGNATFSNNNITYQYPSSWQSIYIPFSFDRSILGNTNVTNVFPNKTENLSLEILIPNTGILNLLSSFSNLNSFYYSFKYLNNRNLSNLLNYHFNFIPSAIVVGNTFVGKQGQEYFNQLIINTSKLLNISTNQTLPINISAQLNNYIQRYLSKNQLNVSYSSITAYIDNISGSKGYEIYLYNLSFHSNTFNFSNHSYAFAFTVNKGEACFILGLSYNSQQEVMSAFKQILGSIRCGA